MNEPPRSRRSACEKLLAAGYANVVNVEGGTQAWDQAALPVVRGQAMRPGDLILADSDGCVRIPTAHAADILRLAGEIRQWEAGIFDFYKSPDFSVQKMRERAK